MGGQGWPRGRSRVLAGRVSSLLIVHTPPPPCLGSGGLDFLAYPGYVAGHPGVHPREVAMATDVTPADNSHLDPGAVPATHQGAPGVTLRERRASAPCTGPSWARRGGRTSGPGSHLAGVPALAACTQHVVLDDLMGGVCGGALIAPVTNLIPHDGHLHLLQVVGRAQQPCRGSGAG